MDPSGGVAARLLERGLRRELARRRAERPAAGRRIRWVTVAGGLPPGVDPADRGRTYDAVRDPLG